MKRTLSYILVVTMVLAVLAGCSGNSANDGKTASDSPKSTDSANANTGDSKDEEIKGEITWATHRTELADTDLKKYVEKFKQKYPGITDVKIEGLKDYEQTIRVRMAAGELPDVLSLVKTTQADLPNFYEPLDDLGLNDRIYFKDFYVYEGKNYGISQQIAINGLVYNKKVFKEAGLTPPKTLDELFQICEKLKAKGIVPMSTAFKDAWTLQYWTDPAEFIYGNTQLRNDKVNTDAPYTLDGPYGQGLGIIKQLYDKGYLEKDVYSASWDQTQKDLANGKSAMMYIGNWMFAYLINNGLSLEEIGFVPLPYDNSGTYKGMMRDDWNYAVSKNSKNKPAAKAFIKFMLEESGDDADHMIISVLKDKKQSLPQIDEFMSYHPIMLEASPVNPDMDAVEKKMQFDPFKFIQEVILKDMKTVFEEYNKKWKDAKTALNK